MTTKRSSGPVTNCLQPFKDQNLKWKKENPTALRQRVRNLSAILLIILYSGRPLFLLVKEIGLPLRPAFHQEKVCLKMYPRWVTTMIRHHDQDEREREASYHWQTVKSCC